MVKVHRIEYVQVYLEITGFRPDREIAIPEVAIYVPESKLFLRSRNMPRGDSMAGRYLVMRGDAAENAYNKLARILGDGNLSVTPEQIEVGEGFINWANALWEAQNPSNNASELLKPSRSFSELRRVGLADLF